MGVQRKSHIHNATSHTAHTTHSTHPSAAPVTTHTPALPHRLRHHRSIPSVPCTRLGSGSHITWSRHHPLGHLGRATSPVSHSSKMCQCDLASAAQASDTLTSSNSNQCVLRASSYQEEGNHGLIGGQLFPSAQFPPSRRLLSSLCSLEGVSVRSGCHPGCYCPRGHWWV